MDEQEKRQRIQLADQLEDEQNFLLAVVSGSISLIVCAFLWALFSYASGYSYSFMAIIVGAVVGYTIKISGKGIKIKFGILAGILTVATIILGTMLVGAIDAAVYYDTTPWQAFFQQSFSDRMNEYLRYINLVDFAFMIIGIGFSSKYAFRNLSKAEHSALFTKQMYVG